MLNGCSVDERMQRLAKGMEKLVRIVTGGTSSVGRYRRVDPDGSTKWLLRGAHVVEMRWRGRKVDQLASEAGSVMAAEEELRDRTIARITARIK